MGIEFDREEREPTLEAEEVDRGGDVRAFADSFGLAFIVGFLGAVFFIDVVANVQRTP